MRLSHLLIHGTHRSKIGIEVLAVIDRISHFVLLVLSRSFFRHLLQSLPFQSINLRACWRLRVGDRAVMRLDPAQVDERLHACVCLYHELASWSLLIPIIEAISAQIRRSHHSIEARFRHWILELSNQPSITWSMLHPLHHRVRILWVNKERSLLIPQTISNLNNSISLSIANKGLIQLHIHRSLLIKHSLKIFLSFLNHLVLRIRSKN